MNPNTPTDPHFPDDVDDVLDTSTIQQWCLDELEAGRTAEDVAGDLSRVGFAATGPLVTRLAVVAYRGES
jgi:hypothetical protein